MSSVDKNTFNFFFGSIFWWYHVVKQPLGSFHFQCYIQLSIRLVHTTVHNKLSTLKYIVRVPPARTQCREAEPIVPARLNVGEAKNMKITTTGLFKDVLQDVGGLSLSRRSWDLDGLPTIYFEGMKTSGRIKQSYDTVVRRCHLWNCSNSRNIYIQVGCLVAIWCVEIAGVLGETRRSQVSETPSLHGANARIQFGQYEDKERCADFVQEETK